MESPSLLAHLISSLLPPELADTMNKHILNDRAPLQVVLRTVYTQAQNLFNAAAPMLEPLLDRILTAMAENQGLVGVGASLLFLALIVIVLNWIRRLLMWWTRLAMRLATWAILFALAAWVWERGLYESARDVVVMGSKVVGYLAVLKDVWMNEYNRYEAQQVMASGGSRSRR